MAVWGVREVGASLEVIEVGFRELVGVHMMPRSHLGQVLGRVSGRYARVGWVLHGRLISHRVGDKMRVGQVLVNDTIQARSARDKASADSRQTDREYRLLSQYLCYVGYGLTCAFALKGASLPVCHG